MELDTSTIDMDLLETMPEYHGRVSQYLGYLIGGNLPPGYPAYFVREAKRGSYRPVLTLFGRVIKAKEDSNWVYDDICRSLWVPLPYEHERVQLWVDTCYTFMRNMSVDDEGNAVRGLTVPENHMAFRHIRNYYPEHTPDLIRIAYPCSKIAGVWWAYFDHKPAPDECPGEVMVYPNGRPHGDTCFMCG